MNFTLIVTGFFWPLLICFLVSFWGKEPEGKRRRKLWRLRIALAIVLLVGTIVYSHLTELPPDELPARFFLSLSVFTESDFCV